MVMMHTRPQSLSPAAKQSMPAIRFRRHFHRARSQQRYGFVFHDTHKPLVEPTSRRSLPTGLLTIVFESANNFLAIDSIKDFRRDLDFEHHAAMEKR